MDRRTLLRRLVGDPGWSAGLLWLVGGLVGTMWLAHAVRDTGIRCPADVTSCGGYQTGGSPASWLVIALGLAIVVSGLLIPRRRRRHSTRCPLCDTVNPPRSTFCGNCGTRLYG